MGSVNPLLGRSVLIVEDEPLIAPELHSALHDAGASIIAATNIKDALELIAYARICAAIVDVNLGGHDCSSVCAALAKRSISFMFYTGNSNAPSLSQ
jgi:DNA-binding response OmpR family regulator